MVRGTHGDAANQQAMVVGVNIAWIRLQSRRLLILCEHDSEDDSKMAFFVSAWSQWTRIPPQDIVEALNLVRPR
eukprot:5528320-Pleurochrysis_carterae.AAC.1